MVHLTYSTPFGRGQGMCKACFIASNDNKRLPIFQIVAFFGNVQMTELKAPFTLLRITCSSESNVIRIGLSSTLLLAICCVTLVLFGKSGSGLDPGTKAEFLRPCLQCYRSSFDPSQRCKRGQKRLWD